MSDMNKVGMKIIAIILNILTLDPCDIIEIHAVVMPTTLLLC